jgi:hypothetical protein
MSKACVVVAGDEGEEEEDEEEAKSTVADVEAVQSSISTPNVFDQEGGQDEEEEEEQVGNSILQQPENEESFSIAAAFEDVQQLQVGEGGGEGGGGGGGVSILQQSEVEEHALMAAAVRDVEEEEIGEEDSWMFLLPDEVLLAVLARVETVKDRNSFSVVCRRFYEMDRIHRSHLKVGCGLHPAHQALLSLCKRFSHLSSVEIAYSGWLSSDGEQIGDEGLFILATECTSLTKLSLNFCGFIRDPGFAKLANLGANLDVLHLNFIPGITGMK